MQGITFKHTNKQYFLGCFRWFFTGLFFIAFFYILSNIGSFWETHAIETIFVLVMGGGLLLQFFPRGSGKEMKSNIRLTNNSVIVGGKLRMPIKDLELVEYHSEGGNTLHLLYNTDRTYVLYTNSPDAFINHLLKSDIKKRSYAYTEYNFNRGSSVVWVGAEGGREFAINLDNGNYSTIEDGETEAYEPRYFSIVPSYIQK